ncbi:MAG: hypothetical protein ACTSUO_08405 [Candidatus Thorarchaeota archaeon]
MPALVPVVVGRFFLNGKFLEERAVKEFPYHVKHVLLDNSFHTDVDNVEILTESLVFKWTSEERPGVVNYTCEDKNYTVVEEVVGGEIKRKVVKVKGEEDD